MAFSGMGLAQDDDDSALPMADMNVTPLVDVMLVLLIIFMVAAPMMVVGVPVELPKTAAPRAAAPRPPVVLTVTADGKVFLAKDEISAADLPSRLADLHKNDPEAPVYVRGDRTAPYGEVLRVMGRVTQAGITKVSLIAEVEPNAPVVQAR
ncbi:ExbD/TolR family protein [Pseudoroseomonas wenyumeiae]|uniref:ExbD/TolR family protein n=1 Tax=Teichococcus wenyumeiae TaxID=2478470 RepID=A0A3A9J7L6_9PROT|nr:ExbD/TolR family protein [Pseudoroseomonas wenyumeiae]RKK02452.1 ExbD/TolR family protein [Pseudoroseomonas wenyumeiae]RMI26134.1 ExbD/TolR family protein [Pseudoroseomonas wenyumeiae]